VSAGDLRARLPGAAKTGIRRAALSASALWGERRTLPEFVIIGTQRGGTTSLYQYLVDHPDVSGALLTKEVHYFDTNFGRGVGWYRAFFPTRAARERHRRRTGNALVCGEASPYYLFHPLVPERAHALLPDARLIVMLRDPVERAFSHHRHEVELGYEQLSFEEALDREPERLAGEVERMRADPGYVSFEHQHHSYAARGHYAAQLEAWMRLYERDQLCVVISEEFFADPGPVLRRVQEFVGVGPGGLDHYPTWNATRASRSDPAISERLREEFRADDHRLAELLGRELPWIG
jgi:Sulfotransferase domain